MVLERIGEARNLNFYNVVFTGGESTLRWADLKQAIRYAANLGFPVRLVSNAHWARHEETAYEKLRELVDAGLTEINYSTGDEHVRFVPIECIAHGTRAALNLGLDPMIMIEVRKSQSVTRASVLEKLHDLTDEQQLRLKFIESPWMPLDPSIIEQYPDTVRVCKHDIDSRLGCSNVLQTYTLQADGRIGACCGIGMKLIPELSVGSIDRPDALRHAIEVAEGDFMKVWMRYWGPAKILQWASEYDASIQFKGLYAHHCQSCAKVYKDPRVRSVILAHYEEIVADVMQTAWFDEEVVREGTTSPGSSQIGRI
jgi:hypothetical protein